MRRGLCVSPSFAFVFSFPISQLPDYSPGNLPSVFFRSSNRFETEDWG